MSSRPNGVVSQQADASGRSNRINQAGRNQVNVSLSLSRLAAVMLAVAVALSWPSSRHSNDGGWSGAGVHLIETAAGKLTGELNGATRCITYNRANQALLTDCGRGESVWKMSRFSNGYSRFEVPDHYNTCLGVNGADVKVKVVGSWTCGDYNSAWRLDHRSGSYYVLRNQLAEEKGWRERCLTHVGMFLRLAVCADTEAFHWKFQ